MAKLGKYSSGIDVKGPPMSTHSGQGNNGYAHKQNMMGDNGLTMHESEAYGERHTATGNKVLTKQKQVKRKM
jgi:hypothetical protein